MIAVLIILAALIVVGSLLYLHERLTLPETETADSTEQPREVEQGCCGLHIACEKDSLSTALSDEIVYYDDEELDAYRGTPADGYSEPVVEEFRDVLLTMRPDDIAGWARSLQLRGVELPNAVREELLMIVGEARSQRNQS